MKKLFISQPMKGKTDEEILTERQKAVDAARKRVGEDVEVIDSFFRDAPAGEQGALWCLGKSLELMSTADVVYFSNDWDKARGCKIEWACAEAYGIPYIAD